MFKRLKTLLLALILMGITVTSVFCLYGLSNRWVEVVNELGLPITSGLTFEVQAVNSGSAAVIKSDVNNTAMTNSTTLPSTGRLEFWYTPATYDLKISDGVSSKLYEDLKVTDHKVVFVKPQTVLGKTLIQAARLVNTGGTENFLDVQGYISGQSEAGGSAKTYGINVEMSRIIPTLIGDIDDAGLKMRLNNYATANIAGNTLRGFDVQVKNNAANAFMTNLNGGSVAAATKSGSITTNVIGLSVANNLDGGVSDLSLGLDVRSFRQSAMVPTLEAIARFRNGNTTGTGIATGILITSEGGAPSYITNAIDISGATLTGSVLKVADDGTICHDTDTGEANAISGYYTVVIGGATRYVYTYAVKPSE